VLVPVRPQPPAPGEQVSMRGTVFMGAGDALGFATGDGGAAALSDLMAAEPGPRAVVLFDLGRGVFDSLRRTGNPSFADTAFGSLAMRLDVRDGRLVFSMAGDVASARPAFAH
jgi:hypothetical protein